MKIISHYNLKKRKSILSKKYFKVDYTKCSEDIKNIDLLEFGIIKKLSEKWNVSHTHVRRIIIKCGYKIPLKKNVKEFWKKKKRS